MKTVIDVPIADQFEGAFRYITGEIVDVAPHLADVLTFALHRNPYDRGARPRWQVTMIENGYRVGSFYGTRRECLAAVTARAATKTIADVDEANARMPEWVTR